ncbi:MAG: cystathionine beta-lyase, partial [Muribaculaceae bacterium]|nr:cystathionine beta-lyase [Muribaculaceae bacterium]
QEARGLGVVDKRQLFAPIATIAAFSQEGEQWRNQMLRYVEGNIGFIADYCRENIPEIVPRRPQASLLVGLDCRRLGLDHDGLISLFVKEAGLALNDGEMFGPGGEGFMRLNAATRRTVLEEALDRLRSAVGRIR